MTKDDIEEAAASEQITFDGVVTWYSTDFHLPQEGEVVILLVQYHTSHVPMEPDCGYLRYNVWSDMSSKRIAGPVRFWAKFPFFHPELDIRKQIG